MTLNILQQNNWRSSQIGIERRKRLGAFLACAFAAFIFNGCSAENETPQNKAASVVSDHAAPSEPMASSGAMPLSAVEEGVVKAPDVVLDVGYQIFQNQCAACHAVIDPSSGLKSPSLAGPNLWGIFDSQAGGNPNYAFSAAFKNSDILWNEQNLDAFLLRPHKMFPGNKMAYLGLREKSDRDALIQYLGSLK